MLRSLLNAILFGAALWTFGWFSEGHADPVVRSIAMAALGVSMTALAFGQWSFLPVAVGALSPLAYVLLERHSPACAALSLCTLWNAPRLVLARTPKKLVALAILLALLAGVAAITFAAYVEGPLAARLASCLFAGCCLSLVGLVPVESAVAFSLRAAAAVIESPAREAIERAASSHRGSAGRTDEPERWRALLRLADRRAALVDQGSGADERRKELDECIGALAAELVPAGQQSGGGTE